MTRQKLIDICGRIIEGCFYSLVVFVTFSTSLVEIASSVMILSWIVKKTAERDIKWLDPAPVKIILVFWAWTVLSCVNSDFPRESFRGIFKVAEYSLIFIIAATELKKERTAKPFLYVVSASALLICFNGFVQYFTGTGLIRHRTLIHADYLQRISSSFVHPNDFGGYLLIVTIIFLAFLLSKTSRLRVRVFFLASFIVSATSLFLTGSRGAWISFTAALLVFGALKAKRWIAIFLALLLIIFVMLPYTVQERIFDLTDLQNGTTWERLMLWKGTIKMIEVHPVLGFGVNTYSRNFPAYKPAEYPDVRYSHNCYLHMAAEVGVVGALLFLIFLIVVLSQTLIGLHRRAPEAQNDLARGLFAALVGFSLNCMVDTHLYSVNLAVLFHLLLGFCFALSYHAQKD